MKSICRVCFIATEIITFNRHFIEYTHSNKKKTVASPKNKKVKDSQTHVSQPLNMKNNYKISMKNI